VGVRDTPKLLPAALLMLVLAVAGIAAGPASARRVAGSPHPPGTHRRTLHVHKPAAIKRGAAHRRSTTPVRTREAPVRPVPTAKARERSAGQRAVRGLSAASQAAATIASVLATPCQNTELTPSAEDLPLLREAILCLVNRERAEHSVAPLTADAHLQQAAEGHCSEMISADYFAHVAPNGETPVDRIKQTGYIANPADGYVVGENLAWGTYVLSTPKAIVEAWIASPGHLANILESRYTETGIAVAPAVPQSLGEGNPGATYAQEFGVIVH
jgi:uncharacterized protein YkwD